MAPLRNHVEARASRTPARQYVTESHDHKPDAPGGHFKPLEPNAVDPVIGELLAGRNTLVVEMAHLESSLRALTTSRSSGLAVAAALSAEEIAKTASQIHTLACSLHKGIAARLNLEPRS